MSLPYTRLKCGQVSTQGGGGGATKRRVSKEWLPYWHLRGGLPLVTVLAPVKRPAVVTLLVLVRGPNSYYRIGSCEAC